MCVCSYQGYTYMYKRGLQLALVLHNILDAFSYPLSKCVVVATHFVNGHQKALRSKNILLTRLQSA